MKAKKFLAKMSAFVLISIMCISGAGCGKTQSTTSNPTDAPKGSSDKKSVIVGLDDTFVPMGFKDDKGEIVGFDIDLAKETFKRLGMEVKFQPIDWEMKESELNGKKIDMIWNGYSMDDERKKLVAFSDPYLDSKQVIITLSSSAIKTKADLAGKSVGTQSESTSLTALERDKALLKGIKDGKPVLFSTYTEALTDLEAGRLDAIVADEILGRYYTKLKGSDKYRVLAEDLGTESYGVGFRKDDTKLLEDVNKTLKAMKEDGAAKKISEKWFDSDIIKK